MNWRTPAAVLLTGAALLAWSFWLRRDMGEMENTFAQAPRGYYLNDARIRQTSDTGDARYSLRAQRIEQDLQNNQINLAQVTLDYQSDTGATWQLSADRGSLDDIKQRASFSGQVLIRPTSEADSRTQLSTDALDVDLQTQQATTRETVRLRMNDQQLTARGMQANLKQQTLKLESQVRGVFEIQPDTSPSSP